MEGWAELRREHFVRGVSIKELVRRTGLSRKTIGPALRSERPPSYERPAAGSKLDPFKDEIHRLLRDDPKLPGVRAPRAALAAGLRRSSKTVVDDYLREVRPLFAPPRGRFSGRSIARARSASSICGSRGKEVPVGHGQTRQGWVVVACSGLPARGRWRAGVLQADSGSAGGDRALSLAARRLAADAGLGSPGRHSWSRRPPEARSSLAFCGQLRVDWRFCEPRGPAGQGVVERLQGYPRPTSSRDGDSRTSSTFKISSTPGLSASTRAPTYAELRPVDRLDEELEVMRPLPAVGPDVDRRWVTRVAPDPLLRVDTTTTRSIPLLVGRRVEVRVCQREVLAVALDTGEIAARHAAIVCQAPHPGRARARPRAARAPRSPTDPSSRSGRWPATTRLIA